ncbi:uncharacterized protein LODBEIA_P06300 [Lodderomyces beijingensis]|uniref:FAD synthase n=1 Tax=Lodderomyces beijingensis TaxID=1775926 RepID=A0ABP0ZHV8_9ASCO
MTSQDLTQQQQGFLRRCEECYNLILAFQNDDLPTGLVPKRHKGYKYDSKLRQRVKEKIARSMNRMENAISIHGLEEIAISYNGGKDCLVMLILLLATIYKKWKSECTSKNVLIPHDYKLDSVYVNAETPFPELTAFIEQSTQYYHLNPVTLKDSMQHGFQHYLDEVNPKIKSVVVGIRYTDPHGQQLTEEQCTDHDWPKFLRIHPILDWHYVEIWDFLVGTNVEYCSLYDLGYTSLGGMNNTVPNPKLQIPAADGAAGGVAGGASHLPAYMLRDDADALERLGRTKKLDSFERK